MTVGLQGSQEGEMKHGHGKTRQYKQPAVFEKKEELLPLCKEASIPFDRPLAKTKPEPSQASSYHDHSAARSPAVEWSPRREPLF